MVDSFFLNGLVIEIRYEDDWRESAVYIYDCISEMEVEEKDSIINYLYNEGLISDRRIRAEIIRGEDMDMTDWD